MIEVAGLQELGFALERVPDSREGERLVLRDLHDAKMNPLAVDFLEPKLIHRLKHGMGRGQPLAKAIGFRGREPITVFDATAGMGVDAFVIAALGARVRAFERSPVVIELLKDGLRRLREALGDPELPLREVLQEISSRLEFVHADAGVAMGALPDEERPDVIYLDPMYPEEGKSESALPKKAMQMFRRLIGEDLDSSRIFHAALGKARSRVVVKRPLRAPFVLEKRPSHIFEGKTARYDMYLVANATS